MPVISIKNIIKATNKVIKKLPFSGKDGDFLKTTLGDAVSKKKSSAGFTIVSAQDFNTPIIKTQVAKAQSKAQVVKQSGSWTELLGMSQLPIIQVISQLIDEAYFERASDIHIDPTKDSVRVRFRVDGVLQEVVQFPKAKLNELVTRIKILSGLRTDEHQAAQDGRFRHEDSNGQLIDVRVSIAPTYHGENAVLRLLAGGEDDFTLEALGFSEHNQQLIIKAISRPFGMILATGPTGSGKTTTLYTMLKMLNTPEQSIITIEDPVEYAIDGIEQIQVNSRTNLNFANGLRSVLRQDPNVIMVGEIRDRETAGISVNTALTGHLLLSTIHTNDAATTLPRLLDMNIEPYLIASTVNVAIGQRLVRKICNECKAPKILSSTELTSLQKAFPELEFTSDVKFYYGLGCDNCNKTGYKGRTGIHEVLAVDSVIRDAILRKESAETIRSLAVSNGMVSMQADGIAKAQLGVTTIEEVMRLLYE